jgi:hypothetical protein
VAAPLGAIRLASQNAMTERDIQALQCSLFLLVKVESRFFAALGMTGPNFGEIIANK